MKSLALTVHAAVAGLLAMGAASAATPTHDPAPAASQEKCYGVAKAGKNDCQTTSHSCAGTASADGQADSWIYVPAGTCEKIVGGALKPKGA